MSNIRTLPKKMIKESLKILVNCRDLDDKQTKRFSIEEIQNEVRKMVKENEHILDCYPQEVVLEAFERLRAGGSRWRTKALRGW